MAGAFNLHTNAALGSRHSEVELMAMGGGHGCGDTVVTIQSLIFEMRGKSGHHRARFLVKTRECEDNLMQRLVSQKINRQRFRSEVRVKWGGKSSPPRR
jgi:hypothetical protein